jgi:hypothetical protein
LPILDRPAPEMATAVTRGNLVVHLKQSVVADLLAPVIEVSNASTRRMGP